jgi:hypothetical protein
MDWLFKRYANPFIFMDGMIEICQFSQFVDNALDTIQREREEKEEELEWQFFLHRVFDGSFADFKEGIKTDQANKGMTKETIEKIVNDSASILNNFNPETEG